MFFDLRQSDSWVVHGIYLRNKWLRKEDSGAFLRNWVLGPVMICKFCTFVTTGVELGMAQAKTFACRWLLRYTKPEFAGVEKPMKAVILAEGKLGVFGAKTATCLLRYMPENIVAVIDSTKAGSKASEHTGAGGDTPVVASIKDTLHLGPDTLIIGIAPAGGALPGEFRSHILDAIEAGMDVISGLHLFLGDDPEISAAAGEAGVELTDLRRVPQDLPIAQNLAKDTKCLRVLTTGTDCSIGKMVAAWELAGALARRGHDAKFIATGQTGMILSGDGMAVDRVISDFVSGAAEQLVLANAQHEILVVEGQGALQHPSYSGVALGLLHGVAPQAIVLVHQPSRKLVRHHTFPILPLARHVGLWEEVAALVNPAKVVAVALNCADYGDEQARDAIREAEDETGLPATDVVKFGPEKIVRALEEML